MSSRPVLLVLAAGASVQLGAAFSKQLFDALDPTAMVWLRLLFSAAIMLAVARPRLAGHTRQDWLVVLAFGAVLATMNWSIYQSFARMPLGLAVTIEFLGPLGIALAHSRRWLDAGWAVLAGIGVALLGFRGSGVTPDGVLFALLAGSMWAAYIPLSAATGRRWPGLSGLSMASLVGAVVLAVPAVALGGSTLLEPHILLVGVVVALMSSVVPYSCELVALRTMPPRVFGILMSLDPAAAALIGLVVLQEVLTLAEWAAVACIVVASIGVTRTAGPSDVPPVGPPGEASPEAAGRRRRRARRRASTPPVA